MRTGNALPSGGRNTGIPDLVLLISNPLMTPPVPNIFVSTPRSRELLASPEGVAFKAAIEAAGISATYSAFSPLRQVELRTLAAVFHRSCIDGRSDGRPLYAKYFPGQAQDRWVVGLWAMAYRCGNGETLEEAISKFREADRSQRSAIG